jgi:hypothetical protein
MARDDPTEFARYGARSSTRSSLAAIKYLVDR